MNKKKLSALTMAALLATSPVMGLANEEENVVIEEIIEENKEIIEEPVVEESVVEETIEEPVVEESVVEETIEEPIVEERIVETIEEPVVEEIVEEIVEKPIVEEPVVEETIEEIVEEPIVEETVEEEPVVEEKIEETIEEPIVEEPVVEENDKDVIITVITNMGTITVNGKNSVSVSEIKNEIRSRFNINSDITIYFNNSIFNGVFTESDIVYADYDNTLEIHHEEELDIYMTVFVHTKKKNFVIDVPQRCTVNDIKEAVSRVIGVPSNELTVYLNNSIMTGVITEDGEHVKVEYDEKIEEHYAEEIMDFDDDTDMDHIEEDETMNFYCINQKGQRIKITVSRNATIGWLRNYIEEEYNIDGNKLTFILRGRKVKDSMKVAKIGEGNNIEVYIKTKSSDKEYNKENYKDPIDIPKTKDNSTLRLTIDGIIVLLSGFVLTKELTSKKNKTR